MFSYKYDFDSELALATMDSIFFEMYKQSWFKIYLLVAVAVVAVVVAVALAGSCCCGASVGAVAVLCWRG